MVHRAFHEYSQIINIIRWFLFLKFCKIIVYIHSWSPIHLSQFTVYPILLGLLPVPILYSWFYIEHSFNYNLPDSSCTPIGSAFSLPPMRPAKSIFYCNYNLINHNCVMLKLVDRFIFTFTITIVKSSIL